MNLKKWTCFFLALVLVLALCACQKGSLDDKVNEIVNGQDGSGEDSVPDYTAFSDGLDENGFYQGVRALDTVTLPEFDQVAEPEFPKITDRAIEDGDFVNIDYVGSVDGVEFEGGSTQGNGFDVIIGYTSFIDDFIQQLVGHTPGENFDIEVTFPDPYQSEELAGKDAVFNITVNYIWDITEEAANAIGFEGRDGMAQYLAYNNYSVGDVITDPEMSVFLSSSQCGDIPESVEQTVRARMRKQLEIQASQYGLDADTFVQYMTGASSADEYLDVQVPFQAQQDMIIQAIAEREGLTATDEDITEREYEAYVEVYGLPYVKYAVLSEKAGEYVTEKLGLAWKAAET